MLEKKKKKNGTKIFWIKKSKFFFLSPHASVQNQSSLVCFHLFFSCFFHKKVRVTQINVDGARMMLFISLILSQLLNLTLFRFWNLTYPAFDIAHRYIDWQVGNRGIGINFLVDHEEESIERKLEVVPLLWFSHSSKMAKKI